MPRSGFTTELDASSSTWLTNDVAVFSTKSGELLLLTLVYDGRLATFCLTPVPLSETKHSDSVFVPINGDNPCVWFCEAWLLMFKIFFYVLIYFKFLSSPQLGVSSYDLYVRTCYW